jgi:hypothetical protein
LTGSQVAFLATAMLVVIAVLQFWLPYRAGRRPFAIYDQGSAVSVNASLVVMSLGTQGLSLWLGGACGLATGLSACLLVHRLRHHVVGTLAVRWVLAQ